ncbi:MAG: efflux RND transporter periplasmic adaptor subunit [Phycisphaerae bacterium]|nr:efflux RND transporter periplasmic adaptor subunit [Gemmatimonadaceae bacterium]
MKSYLSRRPLRLAGIAAALLLANCKGPEAAKPAPPAEVTYILAQSASVEDNLQFVGLVEAFRTVQVRAQASGVILERPFVEGAQVRAGETLYRIDATTVDADARSARARLAEAEARSANAGTAVARLRPLLVGNAIAKQEVDNAESQLLQAKAAVDQARGAVDAAEKRLNETVVRAEIGGRIGRTMMEVGARVAGVSDLLTTIEVVDPVYVSFRPAAEQQYRWTSNPVARKVLAVGGGASVVLIMPDGSEYPRGGRINFVDPIVDARTGTQEYRAQFENPDRLLVPGQFTQVRIRGLVRDSAIVIPQRSVLQQMGQEVVYVVGDSNKVAVRVVKATSWSGKDWLIESGLQIGDKVVVDGVQKIGAGAVVRPKLLSDSAATGATTNPPPAGAQR